MREGEGGEGEEDDAQQPPHSAKEMGMSKVSREMNERQMIGVD